MEIDYDQNHINAREALLDVVEALGRHNDAVILVGAQAVYVHTESEDATLRSPPSHMTRTSRLILNCWGAARR